MFSVDKSGILTVSAANKNPKLIRHNGNLLRKKPVQLCDGDVLSVGRSKGISWMNFRVGRKRTEIFEPKQKSRKRKLPTKKLIQRQEEETDEDREEEVVGPIQSDSMSNFQKNPVTPISAGKKRSHAWLKKAAIPRGPQTPERNCPSSFKDFSARRSPDDLFGSIHDESVDLPPITPRRIRKSRDERTSESPPPQPKRRKFVNRYSPGKRSKRWNLEELSSEKDDPAVRHALVEELDNESKAAKDANDAGNTVSSKKSSLETQDKNLVAQCDSIQGSVKDSSWLSLPRCPTYLTGSQEAEDEQQPVANLEVDECLTEPGNEESLPKNSQKEGAMKGGLAAARLATDMTGHDWNTMIRTSQVVGATPSVRQSLANLIVAQRLQQQDSTWLPDILQNAIVKGP